MVRHWIAQLYISIRLGEQHGLQRKSWTTLTIKSTPTIFVLDKDKTEGLLMNMTANISIIEDVVSNIYAVPYDAILHDDGRDYVLVATPHKDHYKLKRVDVEKGTDSNFLCEINGKDLKEGELVVIMPKDCSEDDIVDVNIE